MNKKEKLKIYKKLGCLLYNGESYFTVQKFADLIGKSTVTIRALLSSGNRIRKLKFVKLAETVLIPVEELEEFPFALPGRSTEKSKLGIKYKLDDSGNIIPEQFNYYE